ncbi:MAG: DUF4143 domain-containing protein [Blautia massiliensis (ex Durand et al. 2017)]|uniref:DUF4143 domain-containing protein n=1 Tax=Blautia massiliensis (ex Durand et al. 2017) TaxID=1737424 RepID=UPI003990B8B6
MHPLYNLFCQFDPDLKRLPFLSFSFFFIINKKERSTDIRFDLDDYARDDFFRAYITDLSLLMAMKDFSLKQHIIENTLAGNSKGGIFECAVADALHKKGYQLYFYKNETTKKKLM